MAPTSNRNSDELRLLNQTAADFLRMRQARNGTLPDCLVGEPAWDMLLALYAHDPSKLQISSVCLASAVPVSIALRWMRTLETYGLVERAHHNFQKEPAFASLTDIGRLTVERSLRAMLRASGAVTHIRNSQD